MLVTHPDYLDLSQRDLVFTNRFLRHLKTSIALLVRTTGEIAKWWRQRDAMQSTLLRVDI